MMVSDISDLMKLFIGLCVLGAEIQCIDGAPLQKTMISYSCFSISRENSLKLFQSWIKESYLELIEK